MDSEEEKWETVSPDKEEQPVSLAEIVRNAVAISSNPKLPIAPSRKPPKAKPSTEVKKSLETIVPVPGALTLASAFGGPGSPAPFDLTITGSSTTGSITADSIILTTGVPNQAVYFGPSKNLIPYVLPYFSVTDGTSQSIPLGNLALEFLDTSTNRRIVNQGFTSFDDVSLVVRTSGYYLLQFSGTLIQNNPGDCTFLNTLVSDTETGDYVWNEIDTVTATTGDIPVALSGIMYLTSTNSIQAEVQYGGTLGGATIVSMNMTITMLDPSASPPSAEEMAIRKQKYLDIKANPKGRSKKIVKS